MVTARILIESRGLPHNYMTKDSAAEGVEHTAAKYGIRRDYNHDPLATDVTSIDDDTWKKVLRSLGRINEIILMRLRDVTFEMSSQAKSPAGESAQYVNNFSGGKWVRKIILFSSMKGTTDQDFAWTIQHEIGHALDNAPAEQATGPVATAMGHNDPAFQEAARKDAGRPGAITSYGTTSNQEFFAESFAMFVSQPDTLSTLRPNVYDYFKTWQWGALSDPKLNPYHKGNQKTASTGLGTGMIGPF
jgi:hypothetical protein